MPKKSAQKVYVLEDTGNSPGKIYGITLEKETAISVAPYAAGRRTQVSVQEYTLQYGQFFPHDGAKYETVYVTP